jgi:N-acetylneuraminate lyase
MKKINGHIAAPFTPLHADGSINLNPIDAYADLLVRNHIDGVFICGSSGEGGLLTKEERMQIAEKWIEVAGDRLKVIVHTGGTNILDQQSIAAHAQKNGAYAIAAMAPMFLGPKRNEELGAFCKTVSEAAPELPFYYYHIPGLNGINLSVMDLLKYADKEIPNFAGVKYTHDNMYEFDQCFRYENHKYDMLHGLDETFLSGLAYGCTSGVGGTYNHCFGLYKNMKEAFEAGDLDKARDLQHLSHLFVNVLIRYRGNIVGGKRIMKFLGIDCGPNRMPLQTISDKEEAAMKMELEEIGFFNFCNK